VGFEGVNLHLAVSVLPDGVETSPEDARYAGRCGEWGVEALIEHRTVDHRSQSGDPVIVLHRE
jgi:hypothetical protein